MYGVLLNREPMGLQEQTGVFKPIVFNTMEESQNFCENLKKSFNYNPNIEVIPCNIMTKEEYEKKQYSNIPGINEVNTYSRLDFYDGEGEQ